jgi:hypothetical protein
VRIKKRGTGIPRPDRGGKKPSGDDDPDGLGTEAEWVIVLAHKRIGLELAKEVPNISGHASHRGKKSFSSVGEKLLGKAATGIDKRALASRHIPEQPADRLPDRAPVAR